MYAVHHAPKDQRIVTGEMEHEFPDAVHTRDGVARRLLRRNISQQLEHRRPMPRLAFKDSAELLVQALGFLGHTLHSIPWQFYATAWQLCGSQPSRVRNGGAAEGRP